MRYIFISSTLLFALCLPLLGQTAGEIAGIVTDPTGGVIPAANVTVTNTETSATRTTTTNAAGIHTFPSLVPGIYQVRVESPGFRVVTHTGIRLEVQQVARNNVSLEVAEVTESIEVTSDAAMLATENVSVGTVIEELRIVDLPFNGRN